MTITPVGFVGDLAVKDVVKESYGWPAVVMVDARRYCWRLPKIDAAQGFVDEAVRKFQTELRVGLRKGTIRLQHYDAKSVWEMMRTDDALCTDYRD